MALDLRLVQAFCAVAEHRHFGRAAEELHVAQPALSRQIRRLEAQVGATLLARDSRGTRLTAAGEAFLPGAREALGAADAAAAAARDAHRPPRLVVGHVAALYVTEAVRTVRGTRPGADVHTTHLDPFEVRAALLERRVDVAVARLPFPVDGLVVHPLREEPRVLLVPRGHPLAVRDAVDPSDFAREPVVRLAGADPDYAAFWRLEPRPDGGSAPPGPVVATPEDRLEVVAAGEAVALATAAVQEGALRPDLVGVPVVGIDPVRVVVAHRRGVDGDLVAAFVEAARTHLG